MRNVKNGSTCVAGNDGTSRSRDAHMPRIRTIHPLRNDHPLRWYQLHVWTADIEDTYVLINSDTRILAESITGQDRMHSGHDQCNTKRHQPSHDPSADDAQLQPKSERPNSSSRTHFHDLTK